MHERYDRQQRLPQIGPTGQRRLESARVLVVGCGALGCAAIDPLARAGVGTIVCVDRDVVEWSNLQRQSLFDESDAREATPKAHAAARRVRAVNASVRVIPVVRDIDPSNIESILDLYAPDLLVDGTDNAETRYLLNDVCVKRGLGWVYGGAVGVEGRVMPVRPGVGPCLRCLFEQPPVAGALPTCDTAGVLGPVTTIIGAVQAAVVIRMLVESSAGLDRLMTIDAWTMHTRAIDLTSARRADCPCCGQRRFEFLDRPPRPAAVLCGRQAVQLPGRSGMADLAVVHQRLLESGVQSVRSADLLRIELPDARVRLSLFSDGRCIVHGTDDPALARSLVARFVGT